MDDNDGRRFNQVRDCNLVTNGEGRPMGQGGETETKVSADTYDEMIKAGEGGVKMNAVEYKDDLRR